MVDPALTAAEVLEPKGLRSSDVFVAEGEGLDWLIRQLNEWPARVDETRTTNICFLMQSAARTLDVLRAAAARASR